MATERSWVMYRVLGSGPGRQSGGVMRSEEPPGGHRALSSVSGSWLLVRTLTACLTARWILTESGIRGSVRIGHGR